MRSSASSPATEWPAIEVRVTGDDSQLESTKPVVSYYEGIISKYVKLERELEKVALAELAGGAPATDSGSAAGSDPTRPETGGSAAGGSGSGGLPAIGSQSAREQDLLSQTDPGKKGKTKPATSRKAR